jgi:uncharacterized membrane protein YfcA
MELFTMLGQASIMALLSLLVTLLPIPAGLAYLLKPTEQRLAMVRPVSLAGLFSGLAGTALGFINVLSMQWQTNPAPDFATSAVGMAEALVTLFVAFGALTVTWLCVAIGMRRQS